MKGTIHKQRRQFFWTLWHAPPPYRQFLVPSGGNFDQFLTPPPIPIADVVYVQPQNWITSILILAAHEPVDQSQFAVLCLKKKYLTIYWLGE